MPEIWGDASSLLIERGVTTERKRFLKATHILIEPLSPMLTCLPPNFINRFTFCTIKLCIFDMNPTC